MAQPDEAQQTQQARQRLSGGMIASLTGLAVLVIFAVQNRVHIKIHFLFWSFVWPLWVYTIVTEVFGALVWFGLGVIRRHRRRKERRENRRDCTLFAPQAQFDAMSRREARTCPPAAWADLANRMLTTDVDNPRCGWIRSPPVTPRAAVAWRSAEVPS
jgi:uncharacterized integral membrane protein